MDLVHPTSVARRPLLAAAVAVACLIVTGLSSAACATIMNGRHQDVLVRSEPSGASIRLNGVDVGSTPATVRMKRRGPAVLRIEKAGHEAVSIPVTKTKSRWMFGNFALLNPLAAQGMNSMGQWAASAAVWYTGSTALDLLTGGGFKRPPVVDVTLAARPGLQNPLAQPGAWPDVSRAASGPGAARTPAGCWPPTGRLDWRPVSC